MSQAPDSGGPHRERIGIMVAVVGLIIGLLMQTAGLFIWGAKLDNRVAQLEQRSEAQEGLAATVARVDERTASMQTSINRIDQQLTERRRSREGG